MAKSILITAGTPDSVVAGGTEFFECATTNIVGKTEPKAQVIFREAGTLSKLFVMITANAATATSTVRLRVDGQNVNSSITIPAGGVDGVGVFEDTMNSDIIAAGQEVCYSVTAGTGGNISVGHLSVLYEASTAGSTVSKLGCTAGTQNFSTESVSRYNQLVGDHNTAVGTEAGFAQTMIRTAGTIKNLQVYVNSNARTTDTTLRMRLNGGNGNNVVTIAPGVTDTVYEDVDHTDTVAVGDLIDFVVVTGTGSENLSMSHFIIDFVTTNGTGVLCYSRTGAYTQPEPAENFPYIAGSAIVAATGTDTNTRTKVRTAFTFSQMTVSITANGVNAESTLAFRKSGNDGNQVIAIGSGTTGHISDTTHSDVCANTDVVNYRLNTPDVAGTQTMIIRNITIVFQEVIAGDRRRQMISTNTNILRQRLPVVIPNQIN